MEEQEDKIPGFFEEDPASMIRDHRQYYLMVNAISKRVRQLQTGDRALALPDDGSRDPLYVARAEFLNDKLTITPRSVGIFMPDAIEDEGPDLDALLGMDEDEVSFDSADDDD